MNKHKSSLYLLKTVREGTLTCIKGALDLLSPCMGFGLSVWPGVGLECTQMDCNCDTLSGPEWFLSQLERAPGSWAAIGMSDGKSKWQL